MYARLFTKGGWKAIGLGETKIGLNSDPFKTSSEINFIN